MSENHLQTADSEWYWRPDWWSYAMICQHFGGCSYTLDMSFYNNSLICIFLNYKSYANVRYHFTKKGFSFIYFMTIWGIRFIQLTIIIRSEAQKIVTLEFIIDAFYFFTVQTKLYLVKKFYHLKKYSLVTKRNVIPFLNPQGRCGWISNDVKSALAYLRVLLFKNSVDSHKSLETRNLSLKF